MYLPRFDVCRGIDQRIRLEFLPVCPVEWTDQTGAASASDGRSPARPLPRPPASVFTDIAKIRTKKKQTNKQRWINYESDGNYYTSHFIINIFLTNDY